jgi:beta-glucosidase
LFPIRRLVPACAALAALVLSLPAAAPAAGRCGDHPWCATGLSADERAGLLVAELTSDEKVSLLAGDELFGVAGGANNHTGTSNGVSRVGLPTTYYSDGPVAPRQGPATAMPIPMALAATFDKDLAFQHGATIANEAKSKGNDVVFAPTVNVMRTPLNGRTFEAYGEDPWLVTRTTVGWINGAQSQGIIANIKHYAANNQEGQSPGADASRPGQPLGPPPAQGNRMTEDSVVDERTLREVYLPQFEAAVKEAKVGSVMCSYNRLNGQYACENKHLLEDILKGEWGFKGYVLADYGAAHNTDKALDNGLDFEPWPGAVYGPTPVNASIAAGRASMKDVDEHVRRILRTMFAYGWFDRDAYKNDDNQIDKAAHERTAQGIEESAITLLENRGALPLDQSQVKKVALIGKDASTFKSGGGSGAVTPFNFVSIKKALEDRLGAANVTYDDGSDATKAAADAKAADVAVVVAGDYYSEGADRSCLSLECPNYAGDQDGLIDDVTGAQPNTVVVLDTGGPVLTPWRNKVRALVEAWYGGEQIGPAVTRVLFGDADPGGRLPVTFPQDESQLPTAGDPEKYPGTAETVKYKEGVLVGYRWYDAKSLTPAYPFGYGLSYTSFAYKNLKIVPGKGGAAATVSVDVTNTGARTGSAVPQLYLSLPQPKAGVVQPPRELKGYAKVPLAPGQTKTVPLALDDRSFSYWDTNAGDWAIAAGCYGVAVGASSRDLPQKGTISLGGAGCGTGAVSLPGVAVTSQARKTCTSRRTILFSLAKRVLRAQVRPSAGKVKVVRRKGRLVFRLDLRGTKKQSVTLRIRGRDARGKLIRQTRTFRTCTPKKAR